MAVSVSAVMIDAESRVRALYASEKSAKGLSDSDLMEGASEKGRPGRTLLLEVLRGGLGNDQVSEGVNGRISTGEAGRVGLSRSEL